MQGIYDISAFLGGILLSITLIVIGFYMIRRRTEPYRGIMYLLIGIGLAVIIVRLI